MSCSSRSLASMISADLPFYAGDPNLLFAEHYNQRIEAFLLSERADQLTVRIALHAQLRKAFSDPQTQKRLLPFISGEETIEKYVKDPKARAKFFPETQKALLHAILSSEAQIRLREAHGRLAAWERENVLLLQYKKSKNNLSSELLLKTMLLKTSFREGGSKEGLDEQTLEEKLAKHAQLREEATRLLAELQKSPLLEHWGHFIRLEKEIYQEFGISRLLSVCLRRDRELSEPNEGGLDLSARNLPEEAGNEEEFALSRRAAQYALPRIIELCYANYVSLPPEEGGGEMFAKDPELFRYWFLASLTADCPEIGPNTLVGRRSVSLEDYKKHFFSRKSVYVPSLNASHRANFASKVAERQGLPHIVALSPCTYRYCEHNDPNAVRMGSWDLVIYDLTREKVLLMIVNTARDGALNAKEERYRLAAVLRSALMNENKMHHFKCSGTLAEFFFDPEKGLEENYYCIMAPHRLRSKSRTNFDIPLTAFLPFTTCPPRYFIPNRSVSHTAVESAFYPLNFSHVGLNEAAIHLVSVVPIDYVSENILPRLINNPEKGGSKELQNFKSLRSTMRLSEESAFTITADSEEEEEEEEGLDLVIPQDLLDSLRGWLLKRREGWKSPGFIQEREWNAKLKALSSAAVREGRMRTPLEVFNSLLAERNSVHEGKASIEFSNYGKCSSQLSDISTNRIHAIQSRSKTRECDALVEG